MLLSLHRQTTDVHETEVSQQNFNDNQCTKKKLLTHTTNRKL